MKESLFKFNRPHKINKKVAIITAKEAAKLIPSGCCVYVGGDNVGICEPTRLIESLVEQYEITGYPNDLTLFLTTGTGDRIKDSNRGYSALAVPGMVKRLYTSIVGQSPKLAKMVDDNLCEAYNFSMGTLSQVTRAAAANKPGVISKVGLNTFFDPRQQGGKLNTRTTEDLVELIKINDEEYLFYKTVFPDVTLLRGTTADTEGYITSEEEIGCRYYDDLAAAQAAHNRGGLVFVQVKRVVEAGSLRPYDIRIPGMLVDAIIVDPNQPQTYSMEGMPTDLFATGDLISTSELKPVHLDERKVIARRALIECKPNDIGNIGFGVMNSIKGIANEERFINDITLTTETGMIGGITDNSKTSPGSFGFNVNFDAIMPMADMFNFYEGGGLDIAFLSFAQVDRFGNVNVHILNNSIMGTGGFTHIATCAKTVVFGGTLTTGGLKTEVGDGKIKILQEGRFRRFPKDVDQISFNGKDALTNGQKIIYITERCVFHLVEEGVELIEIAPGINIEKDILPFLDFKPIVGKDIKEMDKVLFTDGPMNIYDKWMAKFK